MSTLKDVLAKLPKPREFWLTSSDEYFLSKDEAEKYMSDWKEELKYKVHLPES